MVCLLLHSVWNCDEFWHFLIRKLCFCVFRFSKSFECLVSFYVPPFRNLLDPTKLVKSKNREIIFLYFWKNSFVRFLYWQGEIFSFYIWQLWLGNLYLFQDLDTYTYVVLFCLGNKSMLNSKAFATVQFVKTCVRPRFFSA